MPDAPGRAQLFPEPLLDRHEGPPEAMTRPSVVPKYGFFHLFPYGVLLGIAVTVGLSGRHVALTSGMPEATHGAGSQISGWVTRLISLALVLGALARCVEYVLRERRVGATSWPLIRIFVLFWLVTVGSPALFGAEGNFAHDYLYTLLMGCAALLLSKDESEAAVAAARNGLVIFLAASLLLIPIRLPLVMDLSYSEGVLPGVPRFAGLSSDPVSLGMLAELALLCLTARPASTRWVHMICLSIATCAIVLAQSKISLLSFPFCAACIFWARPARAPRHRLVQQRWRWMVLAGLACAVAAVWFAYISGSIDSSIESFLASRQAASFATFSGRDQIWRVALEEWARHPVLGYGTELFDEGYRSAIGMPFAFNGHGQYFDTLARSGLVGVAGLAIYAGTLLYFSVRCARISGGLSLAILLAILFRAVSEVPLALFGYGPEALQHFLLLAVLGGATTGSSLTLRSHRRRAGLVP
jgi:O-Antigen ligase